MPGDSPNPDALTSKTLGCPRCGYDQRGVTGTWTDSCPLQGTCSECGLELSWAEVLTERSPHTIWCVEHAQSLFDFPWRCVRTMVVTYWPWTFWRSLNMTDRPRWRRIILYIAVCMAVSYVAFATSQACVAWRDWANWTRGGPVTMTATQHATAAHALLLPLSRNSAGTVVVGQAWTIPLPSPLQLIGRHGSFFLPSALLSCAILVSALSFAVLGHSRRIARIRVQHILRITAYGLVMPVPMFIAMASAVILADLGIFVSIVNIAGILTIAVACGQLLWWCVACKRYLKMRHAWLAGVSVWLMGGLATLSAAIWIGLAVSDKL